MKRAIVLLLFLAGLFTACYPDYLCEGIRCYNGGICLDGACECPFGWGGDSCTIVLDSCVLRNCGPHATGCMNNTCICASGYEGDTCQFLSRIKFLGSFAAEEVCGPNNLAYAGTIDTAYFNVSRLVIRGLHGLPETDSLSANLLRDSFNIPTAYILNSVYRIRGGGRINATRDTIRFQYVYANLAYSGIDTACTAVWVRQ
jgi:hypothetical protein